MEVRQLSFASLRMSSFGYGSSPALPRSPLGGEQNNAVIIVP
jgi:hypothetical protein